MKVRIGRMNPGRVLDAQVELVELRWFDGFEVGVVAILLAVDARTMLREWAMARARVRQRLREGWRVSFGDGWRKAWHGFGRFR